MKTSRTIVCGLLLASLLVTALPVPAGAVDVEPTLTSQNGTLELTAEHTRLEGVPGDKVEFQVFIKYTGQEARTFDLAATGPKDWQTSITPRYSSTKIANIRLDPGFGETVVVQTSAPPTVAAGTYDINLEVSDPDLKEPILLQVIITARYGLFIEPSSGLFNTRVTAGRDNFYTLTVQNRGTAAIHNIAFSKSMLSDWTVEFNPEQIASLAAGEEQTVKVNIRPPEDAAAGDYQITLGASGNEARASSLDARVTVETPSIWGWVGVGLVVLVVIGMGLVILRLGRR